MRGEGKRRSSGAQEQDLPQEPVAAQKRDSGIRRKPVPGVMAETDRISPTLAQSSVAKDINRESNAPTPGVDDTPYIHFALDQLTRDEEVRGSRHYPIQNTPQYRQSDSPINIPWPAALQPQHRYETVPQDEQYENRQDSLSMTQASPPRNPHRLSATLHPPSEKELVAQSGANFFVQAPESSHIFLDFIPGTVRPLQLGIYIALLVLYIACLILAAIWSRINTGLIRYGSFGDGRYVLFQYIPALLAVILWFGLVQIVMAVYRIAPFIAMSNASSPRVRNAGQTLPLQPRSFFLPSFEHFGAGQIVIAVFLLLAWAQTFTIPLLGSAFNVYQDSQGRWQWVAVQGVIWTAIALYVLLAVALIALGMSLSRASTGLRWDPRSLADMIVLLERSNALDDTFHSNVPRLGYWHTTHRPTEIFHTWGIESKPARSYGIEAGRITEKRYSDPDADLEAAGRLSKEAFLPKEPRPSSASTTNSSSTPLPWFLTPFWALLWPVVAVVLLIAFLVVSYLPTTALRSPFAPLVPSAVSTFGFSGTNFLYSFLPTLLAMICLLAWMDLDLATRLLAPYAALATTTKSTLTSKSGRMEEVGDVAERTLLVSYAADLPIVVTLTAAVNNHWRVVVSSTMSLLALALPILASGIWWAEFYVGVQRVGVSTHLPAFYTLTAFVVIYALGWIILSWQPASLRHPAHLLPERLDTFMGMRQLVQQSRLLDDVAFRAPSGKVDLVTRLLSGRMSRTQFVSNVQGPEIKERCGVGLGDGLRGFGKARVETRGRTERTTQQGSVKYGIGRWVGRDGREGWFGVDRWR